MKRIALLGLVTLLAGCENAGQPLAPQAAPLETAEAGAEWTRMDAPVIGLRPVECLAEPVLLQGVIDNAYRLVTNANGDYTVFIRQRGEGVTLTGISSGKVWTNVSGMEVFSFHFHADGTPKTYHHSGVIRFHGEPGEPDIFLKHFYTTTVDANGNVRVSTETADVFECQFTGRA